MRHHWKFWANASASFSTSIAAKERLPSSCSMKLSALCYHHHFHIHHHKYFYSHSIFKVTPQPQTSEALLRSTVPISKSQITQMSTKASGEDEEMEAGEGEALAEMEFENEASELGEYDSVSQHLIHLYPDSTDPILAKIISGSSIEQIFDAYNSARPEERTFEQSAQALVSLWDLHKLMFLQIGSLFDPDRDLSHKHHFMSQLINHPTYQSILSNIIENVHLLQDEPIAASLLCLKKLDYNIKSSECQALIQECIKRKATLQLPALSRLCVVLRNEGIYGQIVMNEFFPRISQLINEMDNDLGLRLISIAVRNINRSCGPSLVQLYQDRLAHLFNTGQLQNCDPSIYCKVLLCLGDTKWISPSEVQGVSSQDLQRKIAHLLAPKVKDLNLLDVLSLQRVLEYGALEPPEFINALIQRVSRIIEEQEDTPRLDLISFLAPFSSRSVEQRKLLASYVNQYLDSYSNFDQISQLLLKIIKATKTNNTEVCKKFWDKANQVLKLESNDPKKILKITYDYLNFSFKVSHTFRHINFESKAKQLLYFYIYNYQRGQQPTLISPTDFGRAFAFLIAFGWHSEPIFQEASNGLLSLFQEKWIKSVKPPDLASIARGISISLNYQGKNPRSPEKYFDQILNFTQAVENAIKLNLDENEDLNLSEIVTLMKAQYSLRKASSESNTFKRTVSKFREMASITSFDSKEGKDLSLALSSANYNDPKITSFLKEFIRENPDTISFDFANKFLMYAFTMGLEPQTPEDTKVYQICHDTIDKCWELLDSQSIIQSTISLSLGQVLQPNLVHKIFSVEFLNRLDDEIKFSGSNNSYQFKMRRAYMELNRAVCIEPVVNVPWFHQKFCESIYSNFSESNTITMDKDVFNSLTEILNDSSAIQRDVYSPYFYFLNFLIEFDKDGKPIRKKKPNSLLSLHNLRSSKETVGIGERVGILILPPSAYTFNFRSLRGYYVLRKRHLEILGYRIIEIDPQHWNSMYMSEKFAKSDFLESVIFDKKSLNSNKEIPKTELNIL